MARNDMTREEWIRLLLSPVAEFNLYREEHPEEIPDLCGANFSGANLWRANLSEARLGRTDFSGADLSEANLRGVLLSETNFSGAHLWGSTLPKKVLGEYIQKLIDSIKFSD